MAELPTVLVSIELIPAEPGRALDIRVGRELMGLLFCDTPEPADPSGMCSLWGRAHYSANGIDADTQKPLPAYSTDIGAAWTVVEKLCADRWNASVTLNQYAGDATRWEAHYWYDVEEDYSQDRTVAVRAATAPLAICLAALKTLEADDA